MPLIPVHWLSLVPLPDVVEQCDVGPAGSCEPLAAAFRFEMTEGVALGDRDDALVTWGVARADSSIRLESTIGVRHWLTPRTWVEVGAASIEATHAAKTRRGTALLVGAGESLDAPDDVERAVRMKFERTSDESLVLVDVVAGPWARF